MAIHTWVNTIIRWLESIIVRPKKRDTSLDIHSDVLPSENNKEAERNAGPTVKMTLRQKQSKFARMVADLIIFAYDNGYEITLGDAYATRGHMEFSLHYVRLAIDLNLFKDGAYLTETEDHQLLGEYWESIGGSWGGRFNDGNHYSLTHKGRQ